MLRVSEFLTTNVRGEIYGASFIYYRQFYFVLFKILTIFILLYVIIISNLYNIIERRRYLNADRRPHRGCGEIITNGRL